MTHPLRKDQTQFISHPLCYDEISEGDSVMSDGTIPELALDTAYTVRSTYHDELYIPLKNGKEIWLEDYTDGLEIKGLFLANLF